MPLLATCTFKNPINNGVAPPVPDALLAPSLAPGQGDHVFGDVIGMVETALQEIIGGGAMMSTRFRDFNQTAFIQWQTFTQYDLGHVAATQPIVQRNGLAEPDRHAHVFGGYAQRFQWSFCEVVCTGFYAGQETRSVGGGTRAWRRIVMSRFDDVLDRLVDQTALTAYLAAPYAIRQANAGAVTHPVISLQAALQQAHASQGQGRNRILAICANFHAARSALEGMLMRFDGPSRSWDSINNKWA